MRSKSTGKTLKVEVVQSYFRQVYRVVEPIHIGWDALKFRVLQAVVTDSNLTQEQLKLLVLSCKEHIRQRKRKPTAVDPHRETARLDGIAV